MNIVVPPDMASGNAETFKQGYVGFAKSAINPYPLGSQTNEDWALGFNAASRDQLWLDIEERTTDAATPPTRSSRKDSSKMTMT